MSAVSTFILFDHDVGYKMQKSRFPFWSWFLYSLLSPISCTALGGLLLAVWIPLLLSAGILVPHFTNLLRFVRIPFDTLEFASSCNSLGKHLLHLKRSPFWEGVFSFSRQESLLLTGVQDQTQQAYNFFLTVNCNQNDNYAFPHVRDKSSFSPEH